jgi:hypothetical protein
MRSIAVTFEKMASNASAHIKAAGKKTAQQESKRQYDDTFGTSKQPGFTL